jgi:hypothetical protein
MDTIIRFDWNSRTFFEINNIDCINSESYFAQNKVQYFNKNALSIVSN